MALRLISGRDGFSNFLSRFKILRGHLDQTRPNSSNNVHKQISIGCYYDHSVFTPFNFGCLLKVWIRFNFAVPCSLIWRKKRNPVNSPFPLFGALYSAKYIMQMQLDGGYMLFAFSNISALARLYTVSSIADHSYCQDVPPSLDVYIKSISV